jgi:N,N-dimethylformamidase beta subunit-like protein
MSRALLAGLALFPLGGGMAAGPANPVQLENAKPGTAAWQPSGEASSAIQGYASQVGARPGDAVQLHVSTNPAARYRVEIFRLGWYGGSGGRRLLCLPGCAGDEQGTAQPLPGPPPDDAHDPPIRANWPVTDRFTVGGGWVSGYYLVRFVLTSGPRAGAASWTFLIVREPPGRKSPILVQVPVNTWEAYNAWGGKSLYDTKTRQRMYRVSFDRPYGAEAQSPLWYEIQLVRFLERNGYDVSYQTDFDTHNDPAGLLRHRLVITAGHDEYWTKEMRDGFDAARDGGINLLFSGSNTGYWQLKYEDGGRTLFGYKSLYDPEPVLRLKTALFRDIGRPECELMAVQHQFILPPQYAQHDYTVTEAARGDPWFTGTGLSPGDTIKDVMGPEYDVINPYPDTCVKPGLKVLFHFQGYPTMQNGDAVRFTAPSGAQVFASGAQRFTWALDTWGTAVLGHTAPANPGLQRFMQNALGAMTRPAAPLGIRVRVGRRHLQLRVLRPRDRFVFAARIYVHRGSGAFDIRTARVVCETRTFRCRWRLPRRTLGPVTFAAVTVDPWTTSKPVFSKTVTSSPATATPPQPPPWGYRGGDQPDRWSTASASHAFACALQTLCSWPPG